MLNLLLSGLLPRKAGAKLQHFHELNNSRLFPSDSAARCVPHEAGVACSTAKALEWDAAWKNMDEPSGRAIAGVHDKAY